MASSPPLPRMMSLPSPVRIVSALSVAMNKSARELPMRLCSLAAAKRTIQLLSSSLNGPKLGAVLSWLMRKSVAFQLRFGKRVSPTALRNSIRSMIPSLGLRLTAALKASSTGWKLRTTLLSLSEISNFSKYPCNRV